MILNNIKETFHFLPVFSITKEINALTPIVKKLFNLSWEYHYTLKIGWLFWEINL